MGLVNISFNMKAGFTEKNVEIKKSTLEMLAAYYPSVTTYNKEEGDLWFSIPADKVINDEYIDPETGICLALKGLDLDNLRDESRTISKLSEDADENFSNN